VDEFGLWELSNYSSSRSNEMGGIEESTCSKITGEKIRHLPIFWTVPFILSPIYQLLPLFLPLLSYIQSFATHAGLE
jgi:hypothetical protein